MSAMNVKTELKSKFIYSPRICIIQVYIRSSNANDVWLNGKSTGLVGLDHGENWELLNGPHDDMG